MVVLFGWNFHGGIAGFSDCMMGDPSGSPCVLLLALCHFGSDGGR